MIISTGFPRSGNHFLNNLLRMSFPGKIKNEVTHKIETLEIPNCIVPVRTPYESVPSWSTFCNEKDLEGIARWYLRFNKKILKNIDNLIVIDFVKLINEPISIVNDISHSLDLIPQKISLNGLNKNSNIKMYEKYESPLMLECEHVYKNIIDIAKTKA